MFPRILPTRVGALLIATAIFLGPSVSHADSGRTTGPVHAASAAQAVQILVRPFDPHAHGYNFSNCTQLSPRTHPLLACPETARLRRSLALRRLPVGSSGLPFCRCQSEPLSVTVGAVRFNNGRSARVDVRWDFGSSQGARLISTDTFVVLHRGGNWLVDDEFCAGRPQTSVYKGVAGAIPCYTR